jgi:hypothetical protein
MSMAASPPAPPRLAATVPLFQLRDSVVRDGVTLVLSQTFFQTAYDLSGAPECEIYRVHFCLGHSPRDDHRREAYQACHLL